ncbi:putative cytoplasmic protein [Salmonella enterica subsp. enterica serovar Stanley]|nr:putative cytoplasmic protein [Salmonella enterica subsp. enterica serovar Stanley]
MITLCDKHLEWTDFHNSDKRCCLTGYEIQRQDLLLWPFEYQAVKNWRARQGLSTPMIEHPLMNSPMTTANCPDFSQWQRPEWFNPLVDFLAQRRPELAFLRHLFI